MKAVIISGGTIVDGFALGFLKKIKPSCIVAADHGLEFCHRNHILPDCIVGDFDSTAPEIIEEYRRRGDIPIYTFNPMKDSTDTDIALNKALELGATELYFMGATGSRLDHVLSNIFNLYMLWQKRIPAWIVDASNLITMPLEKQVTIRRKEQFGKYVSYFPLRGEVKGLTLEGFQYPLKDYTLVQGDGGLSVSNEIVEEEARISCTEGILILVQSRD